MPGRISFHGRTQQLAKMMNWLLRERSALVVVSGMGGVGKTAVAAELIHRWPRRRFPKRVRTDYLAFIGQRTGAE